VAGIRDPRITVLDQSHQGVAAARNTGISAASGEYIALLDSDDTWEPDKLAAQLAFTRNGGWEITQTEEVWIRNGRRVNPGMRHRKPSGWIFVPSLELCLISPSSVLISRACWEAAGPFDSRLVACEDYDLWLRCALQYPVGLVPRKLVTRYAGHPDQLSARIIGLDLYRIMSLCTLLRTAELSPEQRVWAGYQLGLKGRRYVRGCLKRDKEQEAERIMSMTARAGVDLFEPVSG
jgi:glycosyltransferase involved in cell wall biosynthesis